MVINGKPLEQLTLYRVILDSLGKRKVHMGEFVYVSSPDLCNGEDDNILLAMVDIIRPGLLARNPTKSGLRIKVRENYLDHNPLNTMAGEFQLMLWIVRVWESSANNHFQNLSSNAFMSRYASEECC